MSIDPLNILDVTDRGQFRAWLAEHHATEPECWVAVTRGRPTNPHTFYYLDAVEEALCFGWIDSTTKAVDGARLLYQVISESYERRAIIFTTNIEFSKWGTVFADDKLAQAIVDRVVHHGRLIEYAGPSHRLENSLMLGKGGAVA